MNEEVEVTFVTTDEEDPSDSPQIVYDNNEPIPEITMRSNHVLMDDILLYLAIGIAAYSGTLIRIGISYYKIWNIETNYCVMYTQLLGCFIMGFIVKYKKVLYENSSSKLFKIFYVSIASGLCGSITTFSSWSMECNKSFFLQWDLSWGNYFSSYNGGRLFEWLVCLTAGVALPILALRFGLHFAEWLQSSSSFFLSPLSASFKSSSSSNNNNEISTIQESIDISWDSYFTSLENENYLLFSGGIILLFICISLGVIVFPCIFASSWIPCAFAAVFGMVGASVRYRLSLVNQHPSHSEFPIGTFAANILGTWILAFVLSMSKFVSPAHSWPSQSLYYGIIQGFCGCLTTVSTWVNELNSLPTWSSYKYAVVTQLVAQLGIIIFYNVPAWQAMPWSTVHPLFPPGIPLSQSITSSSSSSTSFPSCSTAMESAFESLCSHWRDSVSNQSCLSFPTNTTTTSFSWKCRCGQWNSTSSVLQGIFDSQFSSSFLHHSAVYQGGLIAQWPTEALHYEDPTQTIDYCASYENLCGAFLTRIHCAEQEQRIQGCSSNRVYQGDSRCYCHSWGVDFSDIIRDKLIASLWTRRYDMMPYLPYVTASSSSNFQLFATAYRLCHVMFEHVDCPDSHQHFETSIPFSTFPFNSNFSSSNFSSSWPSCRCGKLAIQPAMNQQVFRTLMAPFVHGLIASVSGENGSVIVDVCRSFSQVCDKFLTLINCPTSYKINQGCWNESMPLLDRKVMNECSCGSLTSFGSSVRHAINSVVMEQSITQDFLYVFPPHSPYLMMVSANSLK